MTDGERLAQSRAADQAWRKEQERRTLRRARLFAILAWLLLTVLSAGLLIVAQDWPAPALLGINAALAAFMAAWWSRMRV